MTETVPMFPTEQLTSCRFVMDIISGKWRMPILIATLNGPVRYKAYLSCFPDLSQKVLAAELKELTEAGILERKFYADTPMRVDYTFSTKGELLKPLIRQMEQLGTLLVAIS